MSRRFITSGSATIDTITSYGQETRSGQRIGGAVIYSAQGLRTWGDKVSVGIYTGKDFFDFYGDWIAANDIDASGVVVVTEHARRLIINYDERGTFVPIDGYPEEYSKATDRVDRALIKRIIGPDVYGVHTAITPIPEILGDIKALCGEYGIPFGAEFHVDHLFGLKEAARNTDYFSVNFFETERVFQGIRDYQDAIDLYASFEVPCFLRVGTDGAYFIKDGKAYFSPLISAFGNLDATGCGNSSTAAAFWAMCSGYDPLACSYIGGITAALNAGTVGVIEKVTDDMRAECRRLLQQYIG